MQQLAKLGAEIGAGLGGSLAWLRVDGNLLPVIIVTVSLAFLGGVGGACGRYQYATNQEVACRAKPYITHSTYIAFAAAVTANGADLLCGNASKIINSDRFAQGYRVHRKRGIPICTKVILFNAKVPGKAVHNNSGHTAGCIPYHLHHGPGIRGPKEPANGPNLYRRAVG